MKEFIKNSECFFNFIDRIIETKERSVILDELVEDIRDYLIADRCTLFVIDYASGELVSRVAQGVDEVRIPINKRTLTGCSFMTRQTLIVDDAYDERELKAIDPEIRVSSDMI